MDTNMIKGELTLLNSILSTPTFGAENTDQQIGAYIGTHRAATFVLNSILDAIEEEEEQIDIEEEVF